MTEKESQYAAVRWLNELIQLNSTPVEKRDEMKKVVSKLSHLFGVDMSSYDDAMKLDYTTIQVQEIMSAATDALKAGHFDEDQKKATADTRFSAFFETIKSKQVFPCKF